MVEEAKDALRRSTFPDPGKKKGGSRRKKVVSTHTPIFIAGNKVDLKDQRVVPESAAAEWVSEHHQCNYFLRGHVDVSARELSSVQALFERLFLTAHLPLEMSPHMHRKVSVHTFMETSSLAAHQSPLPLPPYFRSNSSDSNTVQGKVWRSFKFRRQLSFPSSSGSSSSCSVMSTASDVITFDPSQNSQNGCASAELDLIDPNDAVATVCLDQRRPSASTEVDLAISKMKSSYDCVHNCSKHGKTINHGNHGQEADKESGERKGWGTPLQKLKKIIRT